MTTIVTLKNSAIETGYGAQALQKILDAPLDYRLKVQGVQVLKAVREALRIVTRAKEELLSVHGHRNAAGNMTLVTADLEPEQRAECLKAYDILSEEIALRDFCKWELPTSPELQAVLKDLSADEVMEAINLIEVTV